MKGEGLEGVRLTMTVRLTATSSSGGRYQLGINYSSSLRHLRLLREAFEDKNKLLLVI